MSRDYQKQISITAVNFTNCTNLQMKFSTILREKHPMRKYSANLREYLKYLGVTIV